MSFDNYGPTLFLEFNTAAGNKKAPSIRAVKRQFNLSKDEIYRKAGVKLNDEGSAFVVVVTKEAGERIAKEGTPGFAKTRNRIGPIPALVRK